MGSRAEPVILPDLPPLRSPARPLHVSEFGATPDDGICDMRAIRDAIQTAIADGQTRILFDAGVYTIDRTVAIPGRGHSNYIGLYGVTNLALIGQTMPDGRPATRLERKVVLDNDAGPRPQLVIDNCRAIAIRNFVLANDPPLGSTARVVSVDPERDEVVVDVLDDLPSYDGMRCASAHVSDLETGKLRRFGSTPTEGTLTIGTKVETYWRAVPGTDARRLRVEGAGFAAKVRVGDGISWHHRADAPHNQTSVMHSRDVVFDNVVFPNVANMGMLAGYNRNLTFRRVRFEPENGNLAVGGRDGLHLSMNSGHLLMENCYFKGLRMDPLVIRKTFGLIRDIRPDGSIVVEPGFDIPAGDRIRFWAGPEPCDRTVSHCERLPDRRYLYAFSKALPEEVVVGTPVTFLTHSLSQGMIRDCVFEDNFGSAIVNFEENMIVEGCTFDNNAYQIKYGPNPTSGAFVRNAIFRDNRCLNTSWIDIAHRGQPATLLIHSLSRFFRDPVYNQRIEISGNVFLNPHGDPMHAAIHLLHACDVDIRNNTFEGFANPVVIDETTTRNIR